MCDLDWCARAGRNRSGSGLCEAHYYQKRRGKPFTEVVQHLPLDTECVVEGCIETGFAGRLCPKHEARVRRHGDPHKVIPHHERAYRRGEESALWTGDDATYSAAHQRVRKLRGRASDAPCVDCGAAAAQWSYDRNDPNEKSGEYQGRPTVYSTDADHYSPRCVPCHKRFDLAALRLETS